ncbi:hypothetical protein ACJZ2D_010986 [Fusarium nematophilum]
MGWPYEFVTLSDEEKHQRRLSLDYYAYIAHLSAFAPALGFILLRFIARVCRARRGPYREVPGSPSAKRHRQRWISRVLGKWPMTQWWLDYLHFTKRFGIIAASQMPIQYLLALKTLNPFAYIFRSSHEHLNRYHRVLGRIIYLLLILHATFYNVFFIESGIWLKRFFAPVVFAGVAGFTGFHALSGTAMARVRECSYRVFFVTHLAAAFGIPPLIYYHAPSARFYVVEAIGVFVLDLIARKLTTITAPAVVEAIPGTNLLKVSATMPAKKVAKYQARPGSHIYLSIPPASRPGIGQLSIPYLLFEFLYNPFTVASTNGETGELEFVARARAGPMTNRLSQFASAGSSSSATNGRVELNIEGPYGTIGKTFHDLVGSGVSRILLVTGGVGATFAVPLYHAILAENPAARVQLVWAIRSPGDATWASSSSPTGKSLLDDDQVQLFLTGDMGATNDGDTADSIEMSTLAGQQDSRRSPRSAGQSAKRPDLRKIVDDTFRQGQQESIGVLVCGPAEMARELRRNVTPWVMKGRDVWWHNESFGW